MEKFLPKRLRKERTDPRFDGERPDFTEQLKQQTERIKSARVIAQALLRGAEAEKALAMASPGIEIKGLKASLEAARAAIRDARTAPAALHEAVTQLKTTCDDLTKQVHDMHEDLKFEAGQLGNGGEPTSEPHSP